MHYLVASYLGHEPPDEDEDEDDDNDEPADASARHMAALGSLAPTLQASAQTREAVAKAETALDALAALERMHYGEVISDVRKL